MSGVYRLISHIGNIGVPLEYDVSCWTVVFPSIVLYWPVRITVTFVSCYYSAGVGRTGVFVTLSIVLERMRYEGVVDMFQTVKMLRTQRTAMVQTEVSDKTHQMHHFCTFLREITIFLGW